MRAAAGREQAAASCLAPLCRLESVFNLGQQNVRSTHCQSSSVRLREIQLAIVEINVDLSGAASESMRTPAKFLANNSWRTCAN